VKFLTKHSPR